MEVDKFDLKTMSRCIILHNLLPYINKKITRDQSKNQTPIIYEIFI